MKNNEVNKNKYESVFNFAAESIDEIEEQVEKYFPEVEDPIFDAQDTLLGKLTHNMLCYGWTKEELLTLFSEHLDHSISIIEDFDKKRNGSNVHWL